MGQATLHLATERLRLRSPKDRDGSFLLELYNDPDFLRFIGDRGLRSPEDVRAFLEERSGPTPGNEGRDLGLLLVERLADGVRLGICSLKQRDYLPDPDLGFAFLPAFRSQGYAAEASLAVLQHCRDVLGLRRVVAIVAPGNDRSVALLERLGFAEEGATRPPGEDDDLRVYAWTT